MYTILFSLAALLSGAEDPAESALDAAVSRLEETVITPTRSLESQFEVSFSTSRRPAERISGALAPRTVVDAVGEMPGVMMQRTGPGQGSPYIRGLTGFRNLTLVDGVRLNSSVWRDGPNQYLATVDSMSVDHIELVRGPGSVEYGSDAMGGTLNLIAMNPVRANGEYPWGGRVFERVASAERSSITRLQLQGGFGADTGLLAGATFKYFGDTVSGGGVLPETGYDEWDADARVVHDLGDKAALTLAWQHVSQIDAPRTHKTIYAEPFHGSTVGSELRRDLDQDRDLIYLRGAFHRPAPWLEEAELTLSWHRQQEERHRERTGGRSDVQGFDVSTLGIALHAVSESPTGTLTWGGDWYHDDVDSWSRSYVNGKLGSVGIQGPVAGDAAYDLAGLFLTDGIRPSEDWMILAGVRGNYAAVDASEVEDPTTGGEMEIDDRWTAFVGSLRASWYGVDGMNVYGGVSQGFRAPNLSDLTRLDTARTDELEVPTPGLDPERTTTFELGAKGRTGAVDAEVTVFYMLLDDFIMRVPTGRTTTDGDHVVTKKNLGDGWAAGVEMAAGWDMGRGFELFGHLFYMDGRADTYPTSQPKLEREYLDRLPPLAGLLGSRWTSPNGTFVEARVRFADKADRLSTRDEGDTSRIPPGGTPGYAILDVAVAVPIAEWVTLSFGVDNVFDADYRVHGSGQNMPGANAWAVLDFRF